ncbi:MAG: outer membrane protein assembly factor BamE [Herminiimonas sp.]|nr:outer membrane protein assembly factor BamE [Herminiimonas sp.]
MSHSFRILSISLLLATLNSCATWGTGSVSAGLPEPDVIARLGRPTHVYQDGQSHLLEYMNGPFGQTTYMARIGPDGKLVSYEQVLTLQKFGSIKFGEARGEDVLKTVGAPSETTYFPLVGLDAWSYPYKENNVWDSMMAIYFDKAGVARRMENGPDPRRMDRDNGKDR